jgi:hypothetical protein
MADWLVYQNQKATRNDPLSGDLISAMSFLPELGVQMHVISGGQEAAGEGGARTGSTRHDHGHAADVDFYKDGRKLTWHNPDDMPLIREIITRARANGITGIGAGDDYMGPGRFHVGFGAEAVWGANGSSANTPDWLREIVGMAPVGNRRQTSEYDQPRVAGYVPNTPSAMMSAGGQPEVVGSEGDDQVQRIYTPQEEQTLYEDYVNGLLTGSAREAYEQGVEDGLIAAPQPLQQVTPSTPQYTPEERAALDEDYRTGAMPPEVRAAYETAFPEVTQQPQNIAVAPPRVEVQEQPGPAPRDGSGLDLTRKYANEAGGELAAAAAPGVFGPREEGVVNLPNMPGIVERTADAGLTLLGGIGAATGGMAGLAGDTAEAMGVNSGAADRMARDLTAIPEAFAGTPTVLAASRRARVGPTREAASAAEEMAPDGQRPEPPMTRSDVPGQLPPPAALSEAETNRMRQLIAKAANNNAAAREELAQIAKVNPEARAAAERLGITIPADVFATDPAVQQAYGLIRSVKSSDAAAEWQTAFEDAQQRALDVLRADGATLDLAGVSERVRDDLQGTIDVLRSDAGQVFDEVRDAVPTGSRVAPDATTRALNSVITELGGDESLPGPVRRLYKAITSDQGMTYGRIMQERAQIGRAAFRNQGPYADADERTLKALYAALGEDQRRFIAAEVGEDAAKRLDAANELWSTAKDIEDRLIAGFSKDVNGSLAPTLRGIITRGGKGDIQPLEKALSVIPSPMQREAARGASDGAGGRLHGEHRTGRVQLRELCQGLRWSPQQLPGLQPDRQGDRAGNREADA